MLFLESFVLFILLCAMSWWDKPIWLDTRHCHSNTHHVGTMWHRVSQPTSYKWWSMMRMKQKTRRTGGKQGGDEVETRCYSLFNHKINKD